MDPSGPNAEQVRYWNETASQRWVTQQALLDAMLAPLGRRAMGRAAPGPGERVIDVGCGCGDTSLALARVVGGTGRVTGIDVSRPMLERARERARTTGLDTVAFLEADAQTHRFVPEHDLLFSRFGVMFFIDPVAAFSNLRTALAPGGRLAFVCWQALLRNPWMAVPLAAVAGLIPLPTPPAPGAPGPFAFADDARVRGILEQAGFVDVAVDAADDVLLLGAEAGLDGAVELILDAGPVAAAVREAGPSARTKVQKAVRDAIAGYATVYGVRLGAAVWLVSARAG